MSGAHAWKLRIASALDRVLSCRKAQELANTQTGACGLSDSFSLGRAAFMCELFAMSSLKPVDVDVSIAMLAGHGTADGYNHDGWGIAYYEGRDARLIKEADAAGESEWIPFLRRIAPLSHSVLAQIRHVSQGARRYVDTQPFFRELGGRRHTFAHNGNLADIQEDPKLILGNHRPLGDTDSEYAFCSLLARLQSLWLSDAPLPPLAARTRIVGEFASDISCLGSANFVYCDSDALFAYSHVRRQSDGEFRPPGLYLSSRECLSKQPVQEHGVSIEGDTQRVTLVASVPLSDDGWQAVMPHTLVTIARGEVVRTDTQ